MDRVLAVLLSLWALLGLLPVGAWTGVTDGAYYGAAWTRSAAALLVVVLLTVLALLLGRERVAASVRAGLARALAPSPRRFLAAVGVLAAVEAAAVAWWHFGRMPPVIDAWVQYFQARLLLSGEWVAPPPPLPAHFETLFAPVTPHGWFGQYPPIHPMLLALGLAVGAPWLVTPLLAAALPAAVHALARSAGLDERTARLAAVLVLASPFVVAIDASAMNHLPTALAVTAGLAALPAVAAGRARAGAVLGAAVGLGLGLRPLDALALALVAVPSAVAALRARGGIATVVAGAAAATVALLPTLVYNRATTGSPLTFTYALVQGTLLGLERDVPWGSTLTLARAVGLTAIDAHQTNVYLLEWPLPVTLLAAAGCWFAAGRTRLLAGYVLTLVAGLFFYFHRDTLFGPRLVFSAVPALVVLVAAGVVGLADRRRAFPGTRLALGDVATVAVATMAIVATIGLAPARLASHATRGTAIALHPEEDARHAGIDRALIFVPDGLGSRLIVRMWARGVPMARSTRYYKRADACRLGDELARLAPGPDAEGRLAAALADASPGRRVPGASPDALLRLPDDRKLTPRCAAELARDRAGMLQFAPYLYLNAPALDGPIVWARELGAEDTALARRYPDRPVYRYRGPQRDGTSPFVRLAERGEAFAADAAPAQLPK
ncbi:MAG: hypothetical protein IT294_11650 [Deltaproteobacteria bacterium]|nr:hypothetical protein [Deltaproteobacteria bacterium]